MVQYVFTPWRNRQELLLIRQQFYSSLSSPCSTSQSGATPGELDEKPSGDHKQQQQQQQSRSHAATGVTSPTKTEVAPTTTTAQRQRDQHAAVARVSMWMQRGSCPHMVESTALLTAAVLSDEAVSAEHTAASAYAIRAAYSAAFSRFVTGLLDGHQDKQRKQSMYSIAKTIGLPATFVELRHQSTHEELPSQAKLRSAAKKALAWIWVYYWQHLEDDPRAASNKSGLQNSPCADAVLRYLRDETAREELRAWSREELLKTISELQTSMPGNLAYLKCLRLSNELMAGEPAHGDMVDVLADKVGAKSRAVGDDVESGTDAGHGSATGGGRSAGQPRQSKAEPEAGWAPYKGAWKPKPIGMV